MKTTVYLLCHLMHEHGIRQCVLCPGSRNAPLIHALTSMPGMECRRAVDERSAGFLALGWSLQSGRPVAVCVTSGSALANLHPSVAEAHYRNIPLLILSADRPPAWIGQHDGQTLPQPGIFGSLCRKSVHLTAREDSIWHDNRVTNEALLELTHRGGGPVHINIPLTEPLFPNNPSAAAEFPCLTPEASRIIRRTELGRMAHRKATSLLNRIATLPRRMILLGQLPQQADIPPTLLHQKHFALVGEHLCNTPTACTQPDTLLGSSPDPALSPDLLITTGGCVLSKKLKKLLRTYPPQEHWHISREGEAIDTYCHLTRCIEGDPDRFWDWLATASTAGDAAYAAQWQAKPRPFPATYSGPWLTGELIRALPPSSVLHLANSSAVRYAQLFPLPPGTHVECNRGINGIEGSVSSFLGYAMGDPRLQFLICGDLSFFYDMNALWLPGYSANVRILLLNNGGGGIFSTLPLPESDYIAAPHHASAREWATSCGFDCYCVRTEKDWGHALCALTSPDRNAPILVEALTDRRKDAALLRQFYTENGI